MIQVELNNITKVFLEPYSNLKIQALKGIDLFVEEGKLIGIIGPSGAGKTTLLSIIGGLLKPTSGTVHINGKSITALNNKELAFFRREYIGYLWQLPKDNLVSGISLLKNVMLPLQITNMPRQEQITRANELLKRLGIDHRKNHLPHQVSGGEAQRAGIAVALANKPAVLIGDQITGELDTRNSIEVINHLKELKDEFGTTMIIATHRREFIQSTDLSYVIIDGKIANVVSNIEGLKNLIEENQTVPIDNKEFQKINEREIQQDDIDKIQSLEKENRISKQVQIKDLKSKNRKEKNNGEKVN